MSNFNISVFNNQIFFEILSELKLFSKSNIKYYEDPVLCKKDAEKNNRRDSLLFKCLENLKNIICPK